MSYFFRYSQGLTEFGLAQALDLSNYTPQLQTVVDPEIDRLLGGKTAENFPTFPSLEKTENQSLTL